MAAHQWMLRVASVVLGLVLAAAFAANFGCSCGCGGSKESLSADDQAVVDEVRASGINVMTATELKKELASERPPVVVDVLSAESYAATHIKGSISIPSERIPEAAAQQLPDKTARIVVYCASFQCAASTGAASALQKLGYTNVYDFKGGLKQWRELGGPVEGSATGE